MGHHPQPRNSFARQLTGFASAGFLAGGGLGASLLWLDWLDLYTLMMATTQPYPAMLLFVLGLGLLLSPVSLATGLALSDSEAPAVRGPQAAPHAERHLPR